MKKLKLSHFIQLRFNISLYLTIGWWFAKFYIHLLGNLYFIFNRGEKRKIEESIRDVLVWTKRDVNTAPVVSRMVFKGIFSHYYEKLFIAFEDKKRAMDFMNRHISTNHLVVIRRSLLRRKGVILITGHYGAIEYIPTLLAVNNIDISMIAKFKTPRLRKRVFEQADKYGIRMIDGDNKGNILKEAISELRQNRVLVTQCDEIEEWKTSDNINISFLGQAVGLDRTVNILQKRTGAEVIFGVIHRYNLNRYRFLAYSYEQMLGMVRFKYPITAGEVVLKVIEQFICRYPEQWYQWSKYPDLFNYINISKRAERHIAVPYFKPTFDISL